MLRGLFEGWHALALLLIAGVACGAFTLVVVLARRRRPPAGPDRGATAVEYALLCAVCAIIALALLGMTDALRQRFQAADTSTRGDVPAATVSP